MATSYNGGSGDSGADFAHKPELPATEMHHKSPGPSNSGHGDDENDSVGKMQKILDELQVVSLSESSTIRHSLDLTQRSDANAFSNAMVKAGKLTKFQAANALKGRTHLLVVGEYTLLALLGQGGMGQVFKALHRHMDRVVAIKLISPAVVKNPETVARFHREVRTAAKLVHPNIVTAYDAGQQGVRHYLVMEFIEGVDLSRLIQKNGPLPTRQAVEFVLQAAYGLAHAHESGVIHRDIKPGNLLVNRAGQLKILDLGLARFNLRHDASVDLTHSGAVMGTAEYMAPEQATDIRHADHRVDIYSLGCTLYRLLTGNSPYQSDSFAGTLMAHRTTPIPSLREVRQDTPALLETLFRRMLAKHPNQRPATMREVVQLLEECLKESCQLGETVALVAADGKKSDAAQLQATEFDAQEFDWSDVPLSESPSLTNPLSNPAPPASHRTVVGGTGTPWLVGGALASIVLIGIFTLGAMLISHLHRPDTVIERETRVVERKVPIIEKPVATLNVTDEPKLPPTLPAMPHRDAAKWVLEQGGTVRVSVLNREPIDLYSIHQIPADDFIVDSIWLNDLAATSDQDMGRFAKLDSLRQLDISNTGVGDVGVRHISELKSLRLLNLHGTKVTPEAASSIGKLDGLTFLALTTALDDAGIEKLAPLQKLQSLTLTSDRVTDRGIKSIVKNHASLVTLMTDRMPITDSSVESLASLQRLRVLGLSVSPITDASVTSLRNMKGLTQLVIQGTRITPEGVADLQRALPQCLIFGGKYDPRRNVVRKILLAGGRATVAAPREVPIVLQNFNDLPDEFALLKIDFSGIRPLDLNQMLLEEVTQLDLSDSGCSPRQMVTIARQCPLLLDLDLAGTMVNDDHLDPLTLMLGLKRLDMTRTAITERAVLRLKQRLNDCDILFGIPIPSPDRPVAEWVLSIGGHVDISKTDGKGRETIRLLDDLPNREIKLLQITATNNPRMTNVELQRLSNLAHIQDLNLADCKGITDAGMVYLEKLQSLRTINLQQSGEITDLGVRSLAKLRNIKFYGFNSQPITNNAIMIIGKRPELLSLRIQGSKINDAGVRLIADNFPAIQSLNIKGTSITDRGMSELSRLTNLQSIAISDTIVSDATAQVISKLAKINRIEIDRTNLTDRGLFSLANLPLLKYLDCQATQVTNAGGARFRRNYPQIEVYFDQRRMLAELVLKKNGKIGVLLGHGRFLIIDRAENLPTTDFIITSVDLSGTKLHFTEIGTHTYGLSKELMELNLSGADFNGGDLANLDRQEVLQSLDLSNTAISDVHVVHLARIESLRKIDLRGTKLLPETLKKLQMALPNCTISGP